MSHLISRIFGLPLPTAQKSAALEQMQAAVPGDSRDRVFRKAVEVFGTEEDAIKWMEEEAFGLPDRQRPIDLLNSPEGIEMVETYLEQIEHSVFV